MAWRIDEQVLRGEIDNRTPGRVIGKIWFVGREEAVELELVGNPWRDLAGHVLKFTNPDAKPGDGSRLSAYQEGIVGDMTASRKVKIPECSMEELMEFDIEEYDRIYAEERARLMRERGEKDPVLTPEEVEERRQWIEEMNEIAELALVDLQAEKWKGPERDDEERHPLVEECSDFAVALHYEIHNAGWLAEDAHEEHPLWEIQNGVTSASAKLAGALDMSCRCDEWPPDRLIAGNVIVRLKKARAYLRDALNGLDSAEEEALATPQWRHQTRLKVIDILAETDDLLREARDVLASPDDDDDLGIF